MYPALPLQAQPAPMNLGPRTYLTAKEKLDQSVNRLSLSVLGAGAIAITVCGASGVGIVGLALGVLLTLFLLQLMRAIQR